MRRKENMTISKIKNRIINSNKDDLGDIQQKYLKKPRR